jgi:hypothetical protein
MSAWKSATCLDRFENIAQADKSTKCASCGKEPPYLDFSMCVKCRLKAGLHVEPDAVREALAKASDEARRRKEAHERFNQRHKEDAGMRKPWTEADDAMLRENAHLGCKKVAEMLDRTERAVSQRAKKTGVSFLEARARAGAPKAPCAYCGMPYTEGAGLTSHERLCAENPANRDEGRIVAKAAPTSAELLDSAALKSLPSYPEQPEVVVVHPDQITREDVATPEELAGHCDHVEGCNADPAHTDCGADPCELVTTKPETVTVKATSMEDELLDINAEQSATIEVLIERVASLESYRELPIHLRIRDALQAFPQRPYASLSHSDIEGWAIERANQRRYAQATAKLTRLLTKLTVADVAEVLADVERRTA